jgi:pimeloyl-ACP methyl ester carboxylesterase
VIHDRICLEGRSVEYKQIEAGSDSTTTLVFLHEGLGSISLWRDFPDALCAQTGCAGLVYSRWGHGRSDRIDRPRSVRFMHEEAERTLPALLDTLRIRHPILIGHSDGASIALIHAATSADPPRALILEAPHVFVEELTAQAIAETRSRFLSGDLRARLARHHGDNVDALFQTWTDVWLSPEFRSWNIEEYLPQVNAPTLIIQGLQDEYGTPRQVDRVAAGRSRASARESRGLPRRRETVTLMLDGCGHSPHVDQRAAVQAAMATFIRDL